MAKILVKKTAGTFWYADGSTKQWVRLQGGDVVGIVSERDWEMKLVVGDDGVPVIESSSMFWDYEQDEAVWDEPYRYEAWLAEAEDGVYDPDPENQVSVRGSWQAQDPLEKFLLELGYDPSEVEEVSLGALEQTRTNYHCPDDRWVSDGKSVSSGEREWLEGTGPTARYAYPERIEGASWAFFDHRFKYDGGSLYGHRLEKVAYQNEGVKETLVQRLREVGWDHQQPFWEAEGFPRW